MGAYRHILYINALSKKISLDFCIQCQNRLHGKVSPGYPALITGDEQSESGISQHSKGLFHSGENFKILEPDKIAGVAMQGAVAIENNGGG